MRADAILVDLTETERARATVQAAQDYKRFKGKNVFEPGPMSPPQPKRILEAKVGDAALVKHLGLRALPSALDTKYIEDPSHSLIIRDNEPDQARYVLLAGDNLAFYVVGWCWGYERHELGTWRANVRKPAWFIPQGALRAADTLRAELEHRRAEQST